MLFLVCQKQFEADDTLVPPTLHKALCYERGNRWFIFLHWNFERGKCASDCTAAEFSLYRLSRFLETSTADGFLVKLWTNEYGSASLKKCWPYTKQKVKLSVLTY